MDPGAFSWPKKTAIRSLLGVAASPGNRVGRAVVSVPVFLSLRTGRGPICGDSARDAGARRMAGSLLARRAIPRQAAADVLAGDGKLSAVWRTRLVGPIDSSLGDSGLHSNRLSFGPAQRRRAGRFLGSIGAEPGAGLCQCRALTG